MPTEIITALISAAVTLIVSIGTWQVSTRNERIKQAEQTRTLFESYRDELRKRIDALRDEVSGVNANVQQQIAIVELKIDTLANKVEKHNGVVERTYKLEQDSAVHTEQIKVANHRIDDLEAKG